MTQKALLEKVKQRLAWENEFINDLLEHNAGDTTIAYETGYRLCLRHIIDLLEK